MASHTGTQRLGLLPSSYCPISWGPGALCRLRGQGHGGAWRLGSSGKSPVLLPLCVRLATSASRPHLPAEEAKKRCFLTSPGRKDNGIKCLCHGIQTMAVSSLPLCKWPSSRPEGPAQQSKGAQPGRKLGLKPQPSDSRGLLPPCAATGRAGGLHFIDRRQSAVSGRRRVERAPGGARAGRSRPPWVWEEQGHHSRHASVDSVLFSPIRLKNTHSQRPGPVTLPSHVHRSKYGILPQCHTRP